MGRPVGAGRPARRLYRDCPFNPYIVGPGTLTPLRRPEGRPPYILALRGVEDAAPLQHTA